jgi:SAM-dependent methyltransferase
MLEVTKDVLAMYSQYLYPSPTNGMSLSYDIANLFSLLCDGDDLNNRKILDAGCGTGQRASTRTGPIWGVKGLAERTGQVYVVGAQTQHLLLLIEIRASATSCVQRARLVASLGSQRALKS